MNLQTYSSFNDDWPLWHLDGEGRPVRNAPDLGFRPGDVVCHRSKGGTGYGTVIAVSERDDQITVLWSEEPVDYDVSLPAAKRVFPSLFAQSLVSIQPMPQPRPGIFYMDFKYGEERQIADPADTEPTIEPTVGPRKNPDKLNKVANLLHGQYSKPVAGHARRSKGKH